MAAATVWPGPSESAAAWDWRGGYERSVEDGWRETAPHLRRFASPLLGATVSRSLAPQCAEVRTVPSTTFPTLSSALHVRGSHAHQYYVGGGVVPAIVVRLLAGVYRERLCIAGPFVLVGANGSLPTIQSLGLEGVTVRGTYACVLRNLRIVSEPGGHTLRVRDASPLVEGCELVGNGDASPVRGALAGIDVEGSTSRPVFRVCRISGHSGAGVRFAAGAGGFVAACDISRCGCGIWLESGADPLLWRNTLSGHCGAGIVVRSDAFGRILGNTILQNGAGGILVESSRRGTTSLVGNRIWANAGNDLRQSPPSGAGRPASEAGTLLLGNVVGRPALGAGLDAGLELEADWPVVVVETWHELIAALKNAPRIRPSLVEVRGTIKLLEPLVLDRPVILAGPSEGQLAELIASPNAEAVVFVAAGGESATIWRLRLRLFGSTPRVAAACVDVSAGRPVFVDCEFHASDPRSGFVGGTVPTHAVRAAGSGVDVLFIGCTLRGAAGAGLLLERGAVASVFRCAVSENRRGGVFLGTSAALLMEACDVSWNEHFGVVAGPGARGVYIGRTALRANSAGSVWLCGVGTEDFGGNNRVSEGRSSDSHATAAAWCAASAAPVAHSPQGIGLPDRLGVLILDQCTLSRGSDVSAVALGPNSISVMWDSVFQDVLPRQSNHSSNFCCAGPAVRAMESAQVLIAGDGGPDAAWPPPPPCAGRVSNFNAPEARPENIADGDSVLWLDFGGYPTVEERRHRRSAAATADSAAKAAEVAAASAAAAHAEALELEAARRRFGELNSGRRHVRFQRPIVEAVGERPVHKEHEHFEQQRVPQQRKQNHQADLRKLESPRNDVWHVPQPPFPSREQAPPPGLRNGCPAESLSSAPYVERPSLPIESRLSTKSSDVIPSPFSFSGTAGGLKVDDAIDALAWVKSSMSFEKTLPLKGAFDPPGQHWAQQKIAALYSVLAMLCRKDKHLSAAMETVGLAGALKHGDRVVFKSHTGLWFGLKGETVVCNVKDRDQAAPFFVDTKASVLTQGAATTTQFRSADKVEGMSPNQSLLSVTQSMEVIIVAASFNKDLSTKFSAFTHDHGSTSAITSGMRCYLKCAVNGHYIDVKGEDVRCREDRQGTLQRLSMEKIPLPAAPEPCASAELSLEQKVWVFRRSVQYALLEKQRLAVYLSSHRPGCAELLRGYSHLWEAEWRQEHPSLNGASGGNDRDGSPVSAPSRSESEHSKVSKVTNTTPKPRTKTKEWLFDVFSGVSSDDKHNGDLFIGALRSYFATALRLAQLEADCVQRVIEALAEALVSDKAFLDLFKASMLPESERKTYCKPEEVVFGLTYTTLMLNTDLHNKQVGQKMWDNKKFVAAGRDCGVTSGLMMQIFKNLQKEEL